MVVVTHIASTLIAAVTTVWDSITFKTNFLQVAARTELLVTEIEAVANNSITPLRFRNAFFLVLTPPLAPRTSKKWRRNNLRKTRIIRDLIEPPHYRVIEYNRN